MSSQPQFFSVIRPNPAPLWFVSNGEVTVGPVVTNLLKRGVAEGAIPDQCSVCPTEGTWRGLGAVREIAAMHRRNRPRLMVPDPEEIAEVELESVLCRDRDDVYHHFTRTAMLVTGAESAMFHAREPGVRTLVTRAALGSISDRVLDQELPGDDLVLRSACMGRPIFGSLFGTAEDGFFGSSFGLPGDVLAQRFESAGADVGGAAMVPVFVGRSLRGMLELSRPGHAFRRDDLQRAERIAQRALHQQDN
ncbi:MAG TPA: hypothetical protein VHE30_01850 [Polyangiaceae bacterium]|nr:hypothetical protein [Polyangiaceae bacterium]